MLISISLGFAPFGGPTIALSMLSMMLAARLYPIENRLCIMDVDARLDSITN